MLHDGFWIAQLGESFLLHASMIAREGNLT